ncbi:MAG: lysophospholipid acyltransferase family protein [Deltaproteobacteria bacterium]|nr:lysophospholipid acyltransferase family protein [Deltaproteobacteria bacterium]
MRDVLYDFLVSFLRLVTRVFFRSIEVSGLENVPKEGPVVLVGNHPNSLLDPVLISTTCRRRVRFAAKEPLFHGPLRPFLWIAGSVPVKRRQDQVEGAAEDAPVEGAPARVDNNAAFDALTAVLKDGEAFGIFPEGISHTRPELAPLKSGAARIVLSAAASGVPVQIVPCGLSYRQRDRMRSRVLVQFGTPISVGGVDDPWLKSFERDPIAASKGLTASIKLALRAQTINAADFDTLRVLEACRRLYKPPGVELSLAEQAELMRRFIDGWERLHDDVDVKGVYDDVAIYLQELRALSISDGELRGALSWWEKALRLASHSFFLAVMVPMALPGFFIHLPVLAAAVAASRTLTSRGDVRATIQMGAVTALTFVAYCIAAGLAFLNSETWQTGVVAATSTLGLLVLSGAATLRVLDGQGEIRRGLWTFVTLLHFDRELSALRARRDALRTRLLSVVSKHIGNLERIVPAADHEDAAPWLDDDDEH